MCAEDERGTHPPCCKIKNHAKIHFFPCYYYNSNVMLLRLM